jgi:hypothetical protein
VYRGIVLSIVGALSAGLLIFGCGSGDDGEPLTKAQFLKQGDAICKKGKNEYEKDYAQFIKTAKDPKSTEDRKAEVAETIFLPALRRESEELAELEAPPGGEDEVEAILEAFETALDTGDEDPAKFLDTTGGPAWVKAQQLAIDYGFKFCIQA